jgi:hypothetical protein
MIAPLPRCPVHGQMHYREAPPFPPTGECSPGRWVCHGFDGEGCEYAVEDDALDWTPIGTAKGITWT